MPSNNAKYTQEFREETARYVIESGKSSTSVAEEIGIDKNTVCTWVRAYRRKNGMPSYTENRALSGQHEEIPARTESLGKDPVFPERAETGFQGGSPGTSSRR